MVRIGMYAIYQGKEYKAARVNGELYKLIADGIEPEAGFVRSEFALVGVKTVHLQDLDRVYVVKTYADFRGERLEVVEESDDTVTVATSDASIAVRLGLKKLDRLDYRLKVNKSEVLRFVEEIRPC